MLVGDGFALLAREDSLEWIHPGALDPFAVWWDGLWQGLNVVSQEVVVIERNSADGW